MQDGVKSQRAYIAGRAESPWREFHPLPSNPNHEQLIYGALGRMDIVTLSEEGETRVRRR